MPETLKNKMVSGNPLSYSLSLSLYIYIFIYLFIYLFRVIIRNYEKYLSEKIGDQWGNHMCINKVSRGIQLHKLVEIDSKIGEICVYARIFF
jgi:hypothetical protein